jgi:hypothetical protein
MKMRACASASASQSQFMLSVLPTETELLFCAMSADINIPFLIGCKYPVSDLPALGKGPMLPQQPG